MGGVLWSGHKGHAPERVASFAPWATRAVAFWLKPTARRSWEWTDQDSVRADTEHRDSSTRSIRSSPLDAALLRQPRLPARGTVWSGQPRSARGQGGRTVAHAALLGL